MTSPHHVRCLDDELSEYAAGRLDDTRSLAWDRHLVACEMCRRAVGAERRLREALAGGPSMPGDLRTTLIAMGRDLDPGPVGFREPLALLSPGDRPCHRSPLRATVVAAAAVGVSAAAAWSLTVIGAPATRVAVVSGSPSPAASPVGPTRSAPPATTASLVSVRWMSGTSVSQPATRQAESTP
ncbi:anti-sigma factor [uncultured Phycicoccus sp.]|uniref:anti-sigma factor family protein n=1 Tax=uncultured Phycicoccus sp. TaxID=661422 RepID=UPI002612841E|nr:hypothetical protein [uncultured Phycicoccus sp.]